MKTRGNLEPICREGGNVLGLIPVTMGVVMLASVLIAGCLEGNPLEVVASPDLAFDASMVQPAGGDVRGRFGPNNPFVHYLGDTAFSFEPNYGLGVLQFEGSTQFSGTLSYRGRSVIGGYFGTHLFSPEYLDEPETSGKWEARGSRLILKFYARTDTVLYKVDGRGLYLLTRYFSNIPPISASVGARIPVSARDTLVWIFKR